ncbi:autotransporter assembly complex protein TamA (plasmid) [Paracoccus sp. TK19116]|uniref:Autotransporter assembly complex protein TamA n=1 Tax=Paracoccus albicereus TaxID=2922394 RepID=A0ABT1MLM6_9RHOB|nr:autotransporter assembly complex family protein [Paracoccus albicereus]MCQ0969192.1 autotransporter assembly complex protein TamA [Paracoccus albicereus]
MRASWAAFIAAFAMVSPATVDAQSSSPFSGLFGRGSEAEGPVSLDVRVAGDDGDLERSIRNTSLIRAALDEGRTTGQDVLAAARADYARILGALFDDGRYSAVITITLDGQEASQIAPLDAPDLVSQVVISVDPGPQFTFSRAEIAPVAPGSDIPEEYAVGEPGGTGVIKSAAAAGVSGWRDVGHAKADVGGQEIVADHNVNTVDSRVALAPGPTVSFGRLNVTGNQRLNERRLRKIAGFPSGLRYSPEAIETVRRRLRRTGIFSAITLEEAELLNPDNSMDVNLTVVEQKPRRVGVGFEISNTEGAKVSAFWMHRNLLGGGERLRIEGETSDIGSKDSGMDYRLSTRLERPATFHPDITAYIELTAERRRGEEDDDYDSDTVAAAFGANYIHSERLTADAAIQYQFQRVDDGGGLETDYKVVAFPMDVTWDARDEPTDAKRGYWLSGDLVPFIGLGDTDSGAQILGEARGYRSFGADDRLTFAGRARVGSVLGADIENTPRDYLFFSGGGGSVRGQPFESLGAREIIGPDGPILTGGMSVANATAEIRWQFRERIGAVAFADYGRVWTDSAFDGDSDWHSGAGIGIRYATPIGPLRFDVAGPVGGDTGEGVQLYLGLGQAF